ncbi:MerR family transcriptional regulator [Gryllotalpicola sp.]|uniref:transcriptional regulator FtsR n=1 Tax=Gryllotalpicola sp. TaxID=1932787 RepID=UPI00263581F4|nr:MerR family transcriptional regulator [Gryllotalpicola sp.]
MARVTGQARPAQSLLSIGQVLAKLTPEFADLSPSKLRFLEEQGLVSPSRTPSGYRKYAPGDLERLRLILTMQRDRYLPLKVIGDYLADLDRGLSPLLPGQAGPSVPGILATGRRFTREDLVREAGATPQLLSDAVTALLIPAADVFGEDALHVLASLVDLQSRGIEPRHLRALRAAVEREAGLIESAVAPLVRRRDAASRAKAAEAAHDIARSLDVVRSQLLRAAVERLA